MHSIKRIFLTPGEPAGIGPDIIITCAQEYWNAELIVIADPDLLMGRARLLNLPLKLNEWEGHVPAKPHTPGTLHIIPVKLAHLAIPGQLDAAHSQTVITTLQLAADACKERLGQAIVTGPVHKEIINKAGIPFTGHTEFFAQHSHVPRTVMLFVVDQLKVALATTHLALAEVPNTITHDLLHETLTILHNGLKQYFHYATPRILVCGLNPHAGEGGYLGQEEINCITPVINELRAQQKLIMGPLAADTIFTPKQLQHADAVLAMYHDQALPLVKYIGFGHAVNVTLGLPYIRTSVDHGVALDVAGTGKADSGSMQAAIKLAIQMAEAV